MNMETFIQFSKMTVQIWIRNMMFFSVYYMIVLNETVLNLILPNTYKLLKRQSMV